MTSNQLDTKNNLSKWNSRTTPLRPPTNTRTLIPTHTPRDISPPSTKTKKNLFNLFSSGNKVLAKITKDLSREELSGRKHLKY